MPTQHNWSVESVASRIEKTHKLVSDNHPSTQYVFTQLFSDHTTNIAHAMSSPTPSPLAGSIVSVKDLFDVSGYVTRAGSAFMAGNAKADRDAEPVHLLRKAGAVILGHTNMTELAYSGLGLNPHYGTPDNAIMPGCIPGGSTSGGAVSVAHGFADIAVGTDTGGSVRIPAAFNGVVGFKPTQSTVSRLGCKTLSQSLDSVGPIARSVDTCELAYKTMSTVSAIQSTNWNPTLVIPKNYGLDDMDDTVSKQFDKAVASLSASGFKIEEQHIEAFDRLNTLPAWQLSAVEARKAYIDAYETKPSRIDPRVYSRIARADNVDEASYQETKRLRQALMVQYQKEMLDKIVLLPTVATMPAVLSDIQDNDELYNSSNLLTLRNTSIANTVDGCSISLPYGTEESTIGVMLTSNPLTDLPLLTFAKQVYDALRSA